MGGAVGVEGGGELYSAILPSPVIVTFLVFSSSVLSFPPLSQGHGHSELVHKAAIHTDRRTTLYE